MGYKLLGFVVWKAAKLYLRRRVNARRLALVGGAALVGAAALAVAVRGGERR